MAADFSAPSLGAGQPRICAHVLARPGTSRAVSIEAAITSNSGATITEDTSELPWDTACASRHGPPAKT